MLEEKTDRNCVNFGGNICVKDANKFVQKYIFILTNICDFLNRVLICLFLGGINKN